MTASKLDIVGRNTTVKIAGISDVPAKIDTGADSSSVWASNIKMSEDGTLNFSLFGKKSPYYTGEIIKTKNYLVSVVRSSNGAEQVRYSVKLPLKIKNRLIRATFTLSERSRNNFPILIGCTALKNKFLVNPAIAKLPHPKNLKTGKLNEELSKNPYLFHQKYVKK